MNLKIVHILYSSSSITILEMSSYTRFYWSTFWNYSLNLPKSTYKNYKNFTQWSKFITKITYILYFQYFVQIHVQVNLSWFWTCFSAKWRKFWWKWNNRRSFYVMNRNEFFYLFVQFHKIIVSFLQSNVLFQNKKWKRLLIINV